MLVVFLLCEEFERYNSFTILLLWNGLHNIRLMYRGIAFIFYITQLGNFYVILGRTYSFCNVYFLIFLSHLVCHYCLVFYYVGN